MGRSRLSYPGPPMGRPISRHRTYVSVCPYHLHRYLDEQAFRYNKREMTDGERVQKLVGGIEGKRVTWKELTGKKLSELPKPEPRKVSRYPMGPF